MATLRHRVYCELDPAAREGPGLSLANRLLVVLILLATALAVADTEAALTTGREHLFRAAELLLTAIFIVEYAARLWVAPENPVCRQSRLPRLRYALTPAAIIDLLAIIPTLLSFGAGGALFLRFFRVLRILRLAKLGRMSTAWDDLVEAFRSRRHELYLTVGLAALVILISSTLLYLAEADAQPDKFGSIPRAFWWSVVTLTTVGYGDVYPVTLAGKLMSAMVAVAGIGLIALPAGILAGAFSETMQRRREKDESKPRP
jgi:voltage-gated potassium channel